MKKAKKILQVLYSGLGGHGTVAFSLLNGFYKAGFENHLIFYGIESINTNYVEQIEKEKKVNSYFGIKKTTKTGVKEWIKFYKQLKKIQPDFIILHSPQLIIPAYIYHLFHKTKIITVEHDAISIRTHSKWIVTNVNAILADKIIVLTDFYKKEVEKKLWISKLIKKYYVIPNGIDIDKYKPNNNIFSNRKIRLFMASRMNILRDHITLIEAVKKIHQTNSDILLRIAGDGPTLSTLKEKYSSLNFIHFLGNITENEIINELQQTDIYIHATFAETFSTAILQAMSCALPVIVSDIEGTRHMIQHKENGLVFENKNVLDLQNKIYNFLNDNDFARKIGKQARKVVENNYNMKIIIQKYLKLLEQ